MTQKQHKAFERIAARAEELQEILEVIDSHVQFAWNGPPPHLQATLDQRIAVCEQLLRAIAAIATNRPVRVRPPRSWHDLVLECAPSKSSRRDPWS